MLAVLLPTAVALAPPAQAAQPGVTQISSDPFPPDSLPTATHATELEPDSFAFGSTVVTTFQTGRVFNGGASDICWATTHDGGVSWMDGCLPSTTTASTPTGPFFAASDPVVAYDARHHVWMISWLGLHQSGGGIVDVLVSRSSDGVTWGDPVVVAANGVFYDKNWTVCDNTPSSPFYGNCYTEFDQVPGNIVLMTTSTDGGLTWGAPTPSGVPGTLANLVTIDPPSTAAGDYQATGANFGPAPDAAGISGDVVLVNDGVGTTTDGCEPLVGFPAGAIALVDRGACNFTVKAANAQAAGATAMIVANNVGGSPFTMGGTDPSIVIPSVMISLDDGNTIKAGLPATGTVASNPVPPIATGLGGQPVVQPSGRVVVPYEGLSGTSGIRAFTSDDGGETWNGSVRISTRSAHNVPGLRESQLPSAEVNRDGTVYVAWQDNRFEPGGGANDIVMSTSEDGTTWSPVSRIPIDPVGSSVDHFIPGLAVDRNSAGDSTLLALTYYLQAPTGCVGLTCEIQVGFVSSLDNGQTWSAPQTLSDPMQLGWLAPTSQGRMVGDYISTSFLAGQQRVVGVFAIGFEPSAEGLLDEPMFAGLQKVRQGVNPIVDDPVVFDGAAQTVLPPSVTI
ncbi:MAG TPA: PA domain-containing protein [Actinomycetes bacterium]|nr:PA domain-containing protein [Actinomycetes bacterium]